MKPKHNTELVPLGTGIILKNKNKKTQIGPAKAPPSFQTKVYTGFVFVFIFN